MDIATTMIYLHVPQQRQADEIGGVRMNDERFTGAAVLFRHASRLRSELTTLAQRLPEPDFSPRRPLWTEARSYANCVERLRAGLDTTLNLVMDDLRSREEWKIVTAFTLPNPRP